MLGSIQRRSRGISPAAVAAAGLALPGIPVASSAEDAAPPFARLQEIVMVPSPPLRKRNVSGAVPCLLCGKAGSDPLCCIHPSHLARHEAAGRIQTYRRGQVLFYAGNTSRSIACSRGW